MKYLIATVVAVILILGMFIYIWSVESKIRKMASAEGVESLNDYGTELSSGQMIVFQITDILMSYRMHLSILILLMSFGTAYFCGSSQKTIESEITSADQEQE